MTARRLCCVALALWTAGLLAPVVLGMNLLQPAYTLGLRHILTTLTVVGVSALLGYAIGKESQ